MAVAEGEAADGGRAYAERAQVERFLRAAAEGDEAELRLAGSVLDGEASLCAVASSTKDALGRTALHFAALRDQASLCALLVGLGVAVDARDEAGDSALALACRSGAHLAGAQLLALGADARARGAGDAEPLHHAAGAGSEALVRALLAQGACPAAASPSGPPLLWAAAGAHHACLTALLGAGADCDAVSPDGVPALVLLAAQGHSPAAAACARALLAAGASADARAALMDDATALHVCCDTGAGELARLLLEAGADSDAREAHGCTPIMLAAAAQDEAMTELLLRACTPDARVVPWETARVLAAAKAGLFAHADAPCTAVVAAAVAPPAPDGHAPLAAAPAHPAVSAEALALSAAAKALGDAAFGRGEHAAARQHYSSALQHDPHSAQLLANRSVAALRAGDAAAAVVDARLARLLRPDWPKAAFRLGSALHAQGLFEEAAQTLFEGVQLEPANTELARAFRLAVEAGRAQFQEQQRQNGGA